MSKYANDRAHSLALMRKWLRTTAGKSSPAEAHRELMAMFAALAEEFRTEFDIPGVRYWEHPEEGKFYSTPPGQVVDRDGVPCLKDDLLQESIELKRHEFYSRQGIYFGYDADRL